MNISLSRNSLPTLNKVFRPNLPREYQSTYKPWKVSKDEDSFSYFRSSLGSICRVPNTNINPSDSAKVRAHKQMKDIIGWISLENPSPIDILNRLSESLSPYNKLFAMAVEELSYVTKRKRSAELEKLERDTTFDTARREAEIQLIQEKIMKNKMVNHELNEKVKKCSNKLQRINSDLESIQRLREKYNVVLEEEQSKKEVVQVKRDEPKKEQTLFDEREYKKLCVERQSLFNEIDQLKEKLNTIHELQMDELKEIAKIRALEFPSQKS